ncbi:MAG: TIM-barrel domain-containing protein [Mycobacterium leprae]
MADLTWLQQRLAAVDSLEAAFIVRALTAHGDVQAVSAYYEQVAPRAHAADWRTAAWLWAAGEVFGDLRPEAQAAVIAAARRLLPSMLARTWDETAAYGALYGAARTLAPFLPELELPRHVKALREFVLRECTRGGRLAAAPAGDQVDPSLLLLVPFGLFGCEDLQMIATVQALEGEGVQAEPGTAWLAYYYQMKGTHPRRLAELRAALSGESVWGCAFRLLLAAAEGKGALRHIPTGHDHPYHHYLPERSPRDPLAGRPVEIRATAPEGSSPLRLEWSLNGAPQPPVTATYTPPHWQHEGVWAAVLGPFSAGAAVAYRWVSGETATPWYQFGVLVANGIRRLLDIATSAEGGLVLHCADQLGTQSARVVVREGTAGTLALRLETRPAEQAAPVETAAIVGRQGRFQVGAFTVTVEPEPLRLTVSDGEGRLLASDYPTEAYRWWEKPDGTVVQVERSLTLAEGERLYGTGERFDRLDRRGKTVQNTVYNEYKNQGDRTYIPVPLVLSSLGHGLWANTAAVGELDLGASVGDKLRLQFHGSSLELSLLPGPDLKQALAQFSALTGQPVLPPRWSFGPWMSSNNWDSQAEVERQVRLTEQYDIPSAVLVVEQWSDEATFYLFNDAQYAPRKGGPGFCYNDFTFPAWGRWPDPRSMVQNLHAKGMRVLFWQIPVNKQMGGIRHAQHDLDEAYMLEQGYAVKNADGQPYRIPEGWFAGSLLLDFTNPAAVQWWLERRRYLLDEVGLDGFKTDGGEFIWNREVKLADGTTGLESRNLYANQYIGATYRFVQERTGGDGVTFSRAGYTGAQAFPLHWAGDEASTWKAFRTSVVAGLNAGLSGLPYWGWDLGGFSGDIPTAELFSRSTAMACFCPVMQYHAESKAQFNQDRTPWNIAERTGRPEVIELYRFYAHLRMNLLPYLYHSAIASQHTGLPMMRPLFLMHPADPTCALVADQYYLGDDLLVAPVTEESALGREVYLPEGVWHDFWTGRRFTGGQRLWCDAPWNRIPVFVRAGSILPLSLAGSGRLAEGMAHGDASAVQNLHLYVYPTAGAFAGEVALGTDESLAVQGAYAEGSLSLTLGRRSAPVWIHVCLPGPDGSAVWRQAAIHPGASERLTFRAD